MSESNVNISTDSSVSNDGVITQTRKPLTGSAIVHPIIDFLCLGGASLFILPLLLWVPDRLGPMMAMLSFVIADYINHPHFAASYQIFYRNFSHKAFGETLNKQLQLRYIFAGLIVPLALLIYFTSCFIFNNAVMLGWGANLMLFLVGWHYTKQGYGILMVDAVLKRQFFSDREKDILLYNAYACWIMFWLAGNWFVSEREFWGLSYYSFAFPEWTLYSVGALNLLTTTMALYVFGRKFLQGRLPLVGTIAYITTLYVWLAARFEPMAILFVPAFHSLQYLLMVWRFEMNRSFEQNKASSHSQSLAVYWPTMRFYIFAVLIGLTIFWWAPRTLDSVLDYNHALFGTTAIIFTFWIFINVHHYFIDNVIWRRENSETKQYLFGQ